MIYPAGINSFQAIQRESFSWNCLGNGGSPQMGMSTEIIFHFIPTCSCLSIIILLSETYTLAFPWRHIVLSHILSLVFPFFKFLSESEIFERHVSSAKRLDVYLLTDGLLLKEQRQLSTVWLFGLQEAHSLPVTRIILIKHVRKSK